MNNMLAVDLTRIYKKEQISEFEIGRSKSEEVLSQLRVRELAAKGFIGLATGKKVEIKMPPKFPGKPLSEYLKEIRE